MEFFDNKVVKVGDLIPYALNSRTHSDAQIAQLAASIREFGFTNPVLIDKDKNIIAGHGRVLAARKLQIESVPCIVVTGLDDRKRRALIIADNKLALNAGWDEDALKIELEDLAADYGELIGFSEEELILLAGIADETDMPILATGDKEPFQQKTFTLHDEQVAIVDDAIMLARTNPLVDTGLNENSNGNALALICQEWLEAKNG